MPIPPERQLIVEITVSNLIRSIDFYRSLGFNLIRSEDHFAELGWDNSKLFLDERANYVAPAIPAGNVRVLVSNVDDLWNRCLQLGCTVFSTIDSRYYGLRDFTILDPDGFGIRFATDISSSLPTMP